MLDPQLVERCALYPGFCIDGSQPGPHQHAVETHIELLGDYHVYLSERLVRSSAHLYGMVEAAELRAAEQKVMELEADKLVLEGELAELRPIADSIARAAARYGEAA